MQLIEPTKIDNFLTRFNRFFDCVIHQISLQCETDSSLMNISVEIAAIDHECTTDDYKVNVRLVMMEVKEFVLRDAAGGNFTIIFNGIRLKYFDGLYFLELADLPEDPVNIGDVRQSNLYVAGKQLAWEALP